MISKLTISKCHRCRWPVEGFAHWSGYGLFMAEETLCANCKKEHEDRALKKHLSENVAKLLMLHTRRQNK